MIIPNLLPELTRHLSTADELWVAVALLNNFGLETLKKVPVGCKTKMVIGIDLPTRPCTLREVLRTQESNPITFRSKIYSTNSIFHPKVYVIKSKNGNLVAFIGSANATAGGFAQNIEMNFQITDQIQCQELIGWVNHTFHTGIDFDNDYIDQYELLYKKNRALDSTVKSNKDKFKYQSNLPNANNITIVNGQFFRQSDFKIFSPIYHLETSNDIVNLRSRVRKRLIELNNLIYPRFREYGIADLHLPARSNNYTSYYWHTRGNNDRPMDAIWLNYGKSSAQLQASADKIFSKNIRIQVILRNSNSGTYVGLSLFIGKPYGSYNDRHYIRSQVLENSFLLPLYEHIQDLGDAYWLNIGDNTLGVDELRSPGILRDFMLTDNYDDYYILGRNYHPNDPDLSEQNIAETILTEFAKLYRIYILISRRI